MIHYIKGKVKLKENKFVVVEVAGLGFKVFCNPPTLEKIEEEKEIKLFTYLYLKEEAAEFYGFLTSEELNLFETLNEVSGIGPKTALDLSVFSSIENLKKEMEKEDFYKKIRGIGKKKMQKILLELSGKIKEISKKESSENNEVLNALVSLGFPRQKVKQALEKLPKEIGSTEAKIKEVLKILGKS